MWLWGRYCLGVVHRCILKVCRHLKSTIIGALSFLLLFSSASMAETSNCKVLRIGMHGPVDVRKIDIYAYDLVDSTIQLAEEIFDPLLYQVAKGGRVIGMAAERWEYTDNGKVLKVQLRAGAKWSDGEPVVAEDFVEGLKLAIKHKFNAELVSWDALLGVQEWLEGESSTLPGVTSEGDDVVVLKMPVPYAFDVRNLSRVRPVPTHLPITRTSPWEHQKAWVSNGAYAIDSNIDGEVVLKKNRHYWNADRVEFEQLIYTADSMDESLQGYLKDEIDVVLDVPFKQINWVGQYLSKEALDSNLTTILYVALDTRSPQLQNRLLRQALALVTNKKQMLEAALGRVGHPIKGFLPPISDSPDSAIDEQVLSHSERIEKARSLMKAAGYGPETPLKLTFGYYDIEPFKNTALAAVEQWKEIGVDVEVKHFDQDFGSLLEAFNQGRLHATVFTWSANQREEYRFMSAFVQQGHFNGYYQNAVLSDQLSAALASYHTPDYIKNIRGVERSLYEASHIVPIGWWRNKMLRKPFIKGVGSATAINRPYGRYWQRSPEQCPQ